MSLDKTMNSISWMYASATDKGLTRQEILTDYRARLAVEDEARAQQRRLDLAEQCSDANPPEARIRTWEKLHGLRMPSDPEHPILDVISVSTRLRLCDVLAVQAARKQRNAKGVSIASSALAAVRPE
jgi:hypothetical protein